MMFVCLSCFVLHLFVCSVCGCLGDDNDDDDDELEMISYLKHQCGSLSRECVSMSQSLLISIFVLKFLQLEGILRLLLGSSKT